MSTDDPRDPSIDAAYRETARDEPPRALDERILAAAHRAVAARPTPAGRSFTQRWRVPVALAATVVLSATVTLMVYESEKAPSTLEELSPGKLREDRVAPAVAPGRSVREQESGAREPKPAELREQGRVEATPQSQSPMSTPGSPPRAPGAADLRRQVPEQKSERATSNEAQGAAAPFPAEPPRPAAAPPAPAESRAPIAPRAKDAEQPLAKKRAAPSAPQPQGSAGTMRERALADRPVDRAERDSGAGVADSALRTPEDWVAEIRRVKQAGRIDEANRLLQELRVRFPDYVLPEDLR